MELSALSGKGVSELVDRLVNLAKPGPWKYSEGMVTNRTPEEQACEVIREKVFHYLNKVGGEMERWKGGWIMGRKSLMK